MGYQFIIKKFIQKPELGLNVNFTRLTSGSKDMSIALAEQSSRAMRKADLGNRRGINLKVSTCQNSG